jgi:hypothetical protein
MIKGSINKNLSIMADLEDIVSTESRKLMINIDRRVVNETPFDTGAAKRNWIASVDQADTAIIDVEDGSDIGTAALQAIQQGAAEISGAGAWDTIYIQNNLPYIQRLNEGWSEQQSTPGYIDAIIEQEVSRRG